MGRQKKFKKDEVFALFDEFCEEIEAQGFTKIPSKTEFCRWLSKKERNVDRRTLYNTINIYFPELKKEVDGLMSDTIALGGMTGHYNSTMSIFALKNWCGWGDNGNTHRTIGTDTQEDALSAALREEAKRMQGGAHGDQ